VDQPSASSEQLQRAGEVARAREDYATAWRCFSECLDLLLATTGAQSAAVAAMLFKLGQVAQLQVTLGNGDLREGMARARAMHERALVIRRRILDADHVEIAASLDALGDLARDEISRGLRNDGDLSVVRDLHLEALAIWRTALGTSHPHVGYMCCVLASVYRDMDELGPVRALLQEALHIARLPTSEDKLLRLVEHYLKQVERRERSRTVTPIPTPRGSRLH
jgi:hypothetical protein